MKAIPKAALVALAIMALAVPAGAGPHPKLGDDLPGWCLREIEIGIIGISEGGQIMTKAYSYACRDCEGMEACPASIVAETKDEVWQLMGHHARIAHGENPDDWDQETRDYLDTLIKEVEV